MPALITAAELGMHLQQAIPDTGALHDSAEAAIADATSVISVHLRRDVTGLSAPSTPQWQIDAAKSVCKRVAGRILTNPDQRTSYSGPDGLSYSGGPVRVLTDDERAQLAPLVDFTDVYG